MEIANLKSGFIRRHYTEDQPLDAILGNGITVYAQSNYHYMNLNNLYQHDIDWILDNLLTGSEKIKYYWKFQLMKAARQAISNLLRTIHGEKVYWNNEIIYFFNEESEYFTHNNYKSENQIGTLILFPQMSQERCSCIGGNVILYSKTESKSIDIDCLHRDDFFKYIYIKGGIPFKIGGVHRGYRCAIVITVTTEHVDGTFKICQNDDIEVEENTQNDDIEIEENTGDANENNDGVDITQASDDKVELNDDPETNISTWDRN